MRNESAVDDVVTEDLTVPISGTAIRGTLRRPARGRASRCIVIHPATAVPEALYTGFAEYLAGRGAAVVTYDYRGMGRTGSARADRGVRMRDWIDVDAPAMTRWAAERFPDLPQVAVGHSVGGHALALGAGGAAVRGFVTVASHTGVTAAIPARLVGAAVERRTWSPSDIGVDRIGHMGFFKRAMRAELWSPVADWLEARAAADLPA